MDIGDVYSRPGAFSSQLAVLHVADDKISQLYHAVDHSLTVNDRKLC